MRWRYATKIGMRLMIAFLHLVLLSGIEFIKTQIWVHCQHGFNIIEDLGMLLGNAAHTTTFKFFTTATMARIVSAELHYCPFLLL